MKPLEALLSRVRDRPARRAARRSLPRTIIVSLLVGTRGHVRVGARARAPRRARPADRGAARPGARRQLAGRRRYVWGIVLDVVGAGRAGRRALRRSAEWRRGRSSSASRRSSCSSASRCSARCSRDRRRRLLTLAGERRNSITGILAQQNAMRNPRRTASTAAALMIGLALVSFIAIFGASVKDSFASAIDDQTRADFILSPKNFQPLQPRGGHGGAEAASRTRPWSQFRFGTCRRSRATVTAVTGASRRLREDDRRVDCGPVRDRRRVRRRRRCSSTRTRRRTRATRSATEFESTFPHGAADAHRAGDLQRQEGAARQQRLHRLARRLEGTSPTRSTSSSAC